jgi:hypothetical protein
LTIVSDAPSCGVTYNRHSDDSRGVIYNLNIFVIQATVPWSNTEGQTCHSKGSAQVISIRPMPASLGIVTSGI